MTIKWHYKSILIPLQQILCTCCIFLSSINNTFFSVLVIIFINMSYFCFNYTNTFFIHTMNYFSVVLWIIFLMCIENYFFIGPRIIFHSVTNLFWAYNALWALQLRWTGSSLWVPWATILKTWSGGVLSKRMPQRNIVRERNKRGFHLFYKICQQPVVCAFMMRFSGPKI